MKTQNCTKTALGMAVAGVLAMGCGSDSDGSGSSNLQGTSRYVVSSLVSSPDNSRNAYVTVLDSLASQDRVTLARAREFVGEADMWVHDGSVFISGGSSPTITKFAVAADGRLIDPKVLDFGAHGIIDSAFWNNTFISSTKAYLLDGLAKYVVWNPSTMTISSTVEFPKVEPRDGLIPRSGSSDRGVVVHNGRLYQPYYWTDEQWARRTDDSRIAVFDVESAKFVQTLEAPCPGLDVATADDSGNLYFAPWTGGAGTFHVLKTAATCVSKVATATLAVSTEFKFADVTGGREGSVFRYVGNGQFVMSVFHHERVDLTKAQGPFEAISGLNWHLWRYDAQTHTATEMQSFDWNSGAAYWFHIDGTERALIPGLNYTSSTIYDLGSEPDNAKRLFDVDGYNIRLFKVR